MVGVQTSLLVFCFFSFGVFFPIWWEMSPCRTGIGFAYMYIFGELRGHLKSNTLLISSLPLNLAFQH